MEKIRVGIIGTGFGATVHAPLMQNHPAFEVVAIASVMRGRIEDIKQSTGINNVYTDWKHMLQNEDLDLVSVTSAPYLHKEMVLEALQYNNHILCEKPMALHAIESKEMVEALEKTNRLAFINFEFRYLPARKKVKELLDSNTIGRILHINFRGIYRGYQRAFRKKYWLGQKEQGGGMLGALGSHMIDSLMWWKEKKVSSVYGHLPIHFPEYVDEKGIKEIRTAEDSFQAIGDFEDGTTFSIDFVLSNRNTAGWSLEITGTKGTIVMKDDKLVQLAINDEELQNIPINTEDKPNHTLSDYAKGYYPAFNPMLDQLSLVLSNERFDHHLANFNDGYNVQIVLDAIRKSSETQTKVRCIYNG